MLQDTQQPCLFSLSEDELYMYSAFKMLNYYKIQFVAWKCFQ